MSIQMERFVRKQLIVDAVQVTEKNMEEVAKWCNCTIYTDKREDGTDPKYIKVRVILPRNERQTRAYVGDWVLYAGTGYRVYTKKAFTTTFERAPEDAVVSSAP